MTLPLFRNYFALSRKNPKNTKQSKNRHFLLLPTIVSQKCSTAIASSRSVITPPCDQCVPEQKILPTKLHSTKLTQLICTAQEADDQTTLCKQCHTKMNQNDISIEYNVKDSMCKYQTQQILPFNNQIQVTPLPW